MDGWLIEGRGEAQPWQDFGLAPDQEATAPACSDWPELTSVILRQGICLTAFTGALISRQGDAAGRRWHGLCKFRRSCLSLDVDSLTACGYCRLLETNLRIIHLANFAKCRNASVKEGGDDAELTLLWPLSGRMPKGHHPSCTTAYLTTPCSILSTHILRGRGTNQNLWNIKVRC